MLKLNKIRKIKDNSNIFEQPQYNAEQWPQLFLISNFPHTEILSMNMMMMMMNDDMCTGVS